MKLFISKYCNIIQYYFEHIENSSTLKGICNSTYIICIGLNTVIYVFKMAYYHSKNIDFAYEHTQKACYRFLEYIEQMNYTNTLHNLNNIDAVTFVYKKTIDDLNTPSSHSFHSTYNTNFESIREPIDLYSNPNTALNIRQNRNFIFESKLIKTITYATKILIFYKNEFYFEDGSSEFRQKQPNTIENIHFIVKNHLSKFLSLIEYPEEGENNGNGNNTIETSYDYTTLFYYIKLIQEKIDFSFESYHLFLQEVYKMIVKMKKTCVYPNELAVQYKYVDTFFIEENKNKANLFLENNKMQPFVKFLFTF